MLAQAFYYKNYPLRLRRAAVVFVAFSALRSTWQSPWQSRDHESGDYLSVTAVPLHVPIPVLVYTFPLRCFCFQEIKIVSASSVCLPAAIDAVALRLRTGHD